jgi:hypothetical protein
MPSRAIATAKRTTALRALGARTTRRSTRSFIVGPARYAKRFYARRKGAINSLL